MNVEETKAAAAVMIAYAEGKPIECRYKHSGTAMWGPFVGSIVWDWGQYEYRIAPKPVEVEVWVHPDGSVESKQTCHDPEYFHNLGCTLRRATIHPETK